MDWQVRMTHLGRILVVDDEPRIRSFIGRALTAQGYTTEYAASGAEAVRSCAATRYDLIILDLVIGDMDGREVLTELLSARPEQAVFVVSCVADIAVKVDLLERDHEPTALVDDGGDRRTAAGANAEADAGAGVGAGVRLRLGPFQLATLRFAR